MYKWQSKNSFKKRGDYIRLHIAMGREEFENLEMGFDLAGLV